MLTSPPRNKIRSPLWHPYAPPIPQVFGVFHPHPKKPVDISPIMVYNKEMMGKYTLFAPNPSRMPLHQSHC